MKYLLVSICGLLLANLVIGGLLQALQPNHPADRPEPAPVPPTGSQERNGGGL